MDPHVVAEAAEVVAGEAPGAPSDARLELAADGEVQATSSRIATIGRPIEDWRRLAMPQL